MKGWIEITERVEFTYDEDLPLDVQAQEWLEDKAHFLEHPDHLKPFGQRVSVASGQDAEMCEAIRQLHYGVWQREMTEEEQLVLDLGDGN